MTHKPIQIKRLSLSFPHKICFDEFSVQVHYSNRIGIIGRNGSGKSTLLNILQGICEPTTGEIQCPDDVRFASVPQVIGTYDTYSGGQRFNKALTTALNRNPNILLLDEPTNHLDRDNRNSLIRMLKKYSGTLILASHDLELLRSSVDILWHIENGKIHVFSGSYDDYIAETYKQRNQLEQKLSMLHRQTKEIHKALMKEQERAKKSNLRGEKSIRERKWPTIVSDEKAKRAIETSGRKKKTIRDSKEDLLERLSELKLPEVIIPKFSISSAEVGNQMVVSVTMGEVMYNAEKPILSQISFSLNATERVAVHGVNGSGKSTFIKAMLQDTNIIRTGYWHVPKPEEIGYLDQHYCTLKDSDTVFESVAKLMPKQSHAEIRNFLNDFLFRKNEEVGSLVSQLSGGEKARLSLALIAVKTPKLLILDEITNNLDLESLQHVISILKNYPGAMIVVSHDEDFLQKIDVQNYYQIKDGLFFWERIDTHVT